MKKSRIILGAAVLTIGAMFVGRASKFANPTKIFYTNGLACVQAASSITVTGNTLTTSSVATGYAAASLKTINGASHKLFAATVSGTCSRQIYVKF